LRNVGETDRIRIAENVRVVADPNFVQLSDLPGIDANKAAFGYRIESDAFRWSHNFSFVTLLARAKLNRNNVGIRIGLKIAGAFDVFEIERDRILQRFPKGLRIG